jgi:multiple sugar transport system substrate-binding protein
LCLCFAIILSVSCISACNDGTQTTQPTGTTEGTVKEVPIINYLVNFEPGYELKNDTEAILYWGEKVGVKFNISNPPRDSFKDKVSTTLVSGDLPDMIHFFGDAESHKKYGADLFVAIDEYIDKGDLPNLKMWYDKYPIAEDIMLAPDNHIYGFPQFGDYSFTSYSIMCRGDLLKAGGYDPTDIVTLDDLKNALLAVKNNSGHDYIMINRHGINYFFTYTMPFFGISQDVYFDDTTGGSNQFVFAPELPRFKAYVEFCRYLYENKILHPDFATMTDEEWDAAFANHEVCAMFTEPSRWGEIDKRGASDLPDDAFAAILLPPEVNGVTYAARMASPLNIGFRWPVVISKKSAYIDDCIRAMDYIYSEEGRYDLLYGPQGKYWDFDSSYPGGIKFNVDYGIENKIILPQLNETLEAQGKTLDDIFPNGATELLSLGYGWYLSGVIPAAEKMGFKSDLPGNEDGLFTLNTIQYYKDNGALKDPEPVVQFLEAEYDEVLRIRTIVQTYVQENVLRFINGQKPMSEYDDFVAGFKNLNSEQLTAIYNTAYNRMQ